MKVFDVETRDMQPGQGRQTVFSRATNKDDVRKCFQGGNGR